MAQKGKKQFPKIYGADVLTKAYPVRFCDLEKPNKDGKYQVELKVPMEEAEELNALLYGDNEKLIEKNKATSKAKKPKPLYLKYKKWDEESGEVAVDEEGEILYEEDFVIFRFKSTYPPKVQYKKSIENKHLALGFDSVVQIAGNAMSSETEGEKGDIVPYTLLTLKGVRVHSIVEKSAGSDPFAGQDDDEFEDDEDGFVDGEKDSKPKGKSKDDDDEDSDF